MPRSPLFGELPQVKRVLASLGASGFSDGTRGGEQTDMLIPTMPEVVAEELESTNTPGRTSKKDRATPHIDGFATNRGPGL